VKYVDTLIGAETINTIPPETLNAYRDHGIPSSQLKEGTEDAYRVLDDLSQAGLDLHVLTQQLEDEGVVKFSKAFEKLMAALHEKRAVSSRESVKP
jgi:transaldolase